jgi:predicted dehydrogenase
MESEGVHAETGPVRQVLPPAMLPRMPIPRRAFISKTLAGAAALSALNLRAAEPRLRVAVIGHTGRGDYGHGVHTMWLNLPETELVGVADADPTGLAAAQKKLGLASGYADYRAMLATLKPDIVAIATRHVDQHCEMALAAVDAGARGIYMEKPFCRTSAEAAQIVAACERRNVKLAVAHRNRYHPALAAVDRLLKEGKIGRLLEMRGRGKEDTRGGALDCWVLGPHLFNLMAYFGGNPLSCSATLLQEGRPVTRADVIEGPEGVGPLGGDALHARFEMERGVPAFFDSIKSAGHPNNTFGLQLIGAQGIIDLRIDVDPIAHLIPGSPFLPVKEPRRWIPITSGGLDLPEPLTGIGNEVGGHLTGARDLMAAMREDRAPLCGGRDAQLTVEMVMAIFESHRLNGARVGMPMTVGEHPLLRLPG